MSACNEEQAVEKTNKNNGPSFSGPFTNPYDSVGIAHNLILDAFISRRDSLFQVCDSAGFVNKFNEILAQAACEVGYDMPEHNCEDSVRNMLYEMQEYFYGVDFNEYINENIENQETKDYVYELLGYFDLYDNIDTLVQAIENWEYDVYQNGNINETDKQILLMAGAVGRHSSIYWYNVSQDPYSSWRFNIGCTSGFGKYNPDKTLAVEGWKKVAGSDVGALVAYSVKAWWTGSPWIIGGAAAAAVGASATVAIIEYWDDITGAIGAACDWLFGWM